MEFADALLVIEPKPSDAAHAVLTLCTLYLDSGETMPVELRRWLALYLIAERRRDRRTRWMRTANLDVQIRKTQEQKRTTGRGKVTATVEEYARLLGVSKSTLMKSRSTPESAAVVAVTDHMHQLIDRRFGGKKPP